MRLSLICSSIALFEAWGRYNVSDYALMQHGDYDWIVNFDVPPPDGPINVRQMNYDRARVIPSATMNIGNMQVNFTNAEYVYFHWHHLISA